jgi:hypothetical protein
MQINRFSIDPAGSAGGLAVLPATALGSAALLRDSSASADLDSQIAAYQDLSAHWRETRNIGQRAALAHVLNASLFGRGVENAVNSFTRAAWAGAEAAPPEPQARKLEAFDGLAAEDQQIVARLQTDPATGVEVPSAEAFRARLVAELDEARLGRRADQVSLSPSALKVLDGAPPPTAGAAGPEPANPLLARVLAAYGKASGGGD